VQIENEFFAKLLEVYGQDGASQIVKAFNFAKEKHSGQKRDSGDEYIVHPYNVAKILVGLKADVVCVVCGFLHDCLEDTDCSEKEILDNFGSEVLNILVGASKVLLIKEAYRKNPAEVEILQKMFLTLGKDARVGFVKLAERLDNMQTLQYKEREKQISIAKETLEFYPPIAERLGMNRVKHDIEELCFKFIYPKEYAETEKYLEEHYQKSHTMNEEISNTLKKLIAENGIKGRVQSRVKSKYGVFKKRSKKKEIYDVIAHRIIVEEIKDCYTMLGAVHNLWKPVEGRIKDYIAHPKPNLYMSLHTTVLHPSENGDVPFEVQIRTEEMHNICEYGAAAHWMYKIRGAQETTTAGNSAMLEARKKASKETNEEEEISQIIKAGFYTNQIFVFTPNLNVVELPEGAISLDFAYSVHSKLGDKCIGAKINGKMVPINTKLKTGDIVEVLTSSAAKGPSRDWLKMCKSKGALSKIRAYFKREKRDENIKIGKEMLEEQLKRRGYSLSKFLEDKDCIEEVLQKQTLASLDEVYAAIGYSGVTVQQIVGKFVSKQRQKEKKEKAKVVRKSSPKEYDAVIVDGQDDMLKRVAKCCNPIPGDEIVGYISRGRGVTIHRKDCQALKFLEQERIVNTTWKHESANVTYSANFKVYAKGTANVLNLISNKIAENKIEISYINVEKNKSGDAILTVGVLINSREQLSELTNKISAMPEVFDVKR